MIRKLSIVTLKSREDIKYEFIWQSIKNKEIEFIKAKNFPNVVKTIIEENDDYGDIMNLN